MAEYQRSQLGPLLRHAQAQVPFYQSRLGAVLRADGRIYWDRWEDIPIVSRRDIVDNYAEIQARKVPLSRQGLDDGKFGVNRPARQVGSNDFEVRYVPVYWDVPADEAAAADIFRETYCADARVTFVRTRVLRATPADKYLEYVYEVRSPAASA